VVNIGHEIAALAQIGLRWRSDSDERQPEHVAAKRERLTGIIACREQTKCRKAERDIAADAALGYHAAM
jgi:hypothetical protein